MHRTNEKGSLTVEASIIIPVAILVIIAIVYFSLIWLNHAHVESLAHSAAELGADAWTNVNKDIGTGKVLESIPYSKSLYWRLNDSSEGEKIKKIEDYIFKNMNRYQLIKPTQVKVDIKIKDLIIYKTLQVSVINSYNTPGSRFLKIFGVGEVYTVSSKSEAIINDSEEFIRNTDFLIDLERELETKFPEIKNLRGKAKGLLDDIKNKITVTIN